jgi:hypothetical protein
VKVVQNQLTRLGKEFAKYFVYCCEGEQYVALIDQFRWAKTRPALIAAMSFLLQYGKFTTNQEPTISITTQEWKRLNEFILDGEIDTVRQLHTTMIRYVSAYEMERIRETEKCIVELLIHFDQGDNTS